MLKNVLKEFLVFVKKQASSALFGGIMLFALILSKYINFGDIYRYDFLFVFAILVQIILIITKAEKPKEVLAIIIFHICAMGMEVFKTSPMVGSWAYPEKAIFAISTVPLFTGFMYSSVGSYIARAWRINNFKFHKMPNGVTLFLLGTLIYINFFTNHFIQDIRYFIFILAIIIFWQTKFYATLTTKTYQIHPLITNALLALFVWLAEQIGTFARAWIYPNQTTDWHPVTFHMYTSWYMLLIFSFTIIAIIFSNSKNNI